MAGRRGYAVGTWAHIRGSDIGLKRSTHRLHLFLHMKVPFTYSDIDIYPYY